MSLSSANTSNNEEPEDFWDVEKFPGKRGVYKTPKFNLEFALIADGVPAAEVNAILNAEGGIAFASRAERMGDQTNFISCGPLRKGADQFVNPDILPHLPTAPQNTRNWYKSDTRFWADHRESLTSRLNVRIVQQAPLHQAGRSAPA